jgi:AmmeMemoRadiSam system protein B
MILPRLRADLDFMPSPVEDRPGLLIRDTLQYSDMTLLIPPFLVNGLEFFDGQRTELDLHAELTRLTGQLEMGATARHMAEALAKAGFLEDETYQALKETRHREFFESPVRLPAHAGSAYPEQAGPLRTVMQRYLEGSDDDGDEDVLGIAAPHVSPEGGWESYRAAYHALTPELHDRTFVVLGTSHYGEPDRFGLTRKAFRTPFGDTRTDLGLVDELAREPASKMEDYCHAVEHSIEFQILFLQAIYGPDVKVLPVLCGSYGRSIYRGGVPEDDDGVKSFLGKLGEIAAREEKRLFWVLGVDMAHQGARYGDPFSARAGQDQMAAVQVRDAGRIERMNAGDSKGFWELVQENQDDLKWCGSSPIYTFLKAVPKARGKLRRYDQWNIDDRSVVSFAGVSFSS